MSRGHDVLRYTREWVRRITVFRFVELNGAADLRGPVESTAPGKGGAALSD
jgi:hypothetical protein